MSDELTLGGYMAQHGRAAAFEGSDGQAYSVGLFIDEHPEGSGRFGAALLFVRWSPGGDTTVGHVETDYLSWGSSEEQAERRLKALSLFDVKAALDQAIDDAPGEW